MSESSGWKRIAVIVTGWAFIVLGIVGLFLPVLQGVLFLIVGLVILSTEYHWARRILHRLGTRFPKLGSVIQTAHDKAASVLGHKKKEAGEE